MSVLQDLVKAGALSERIYGRKTEAENDTTTAADAKIDKDAAQVMPGSDAEKKATAASTPSEADDDAADLDLDDAADTAPSAPGPGVEVPVTFLLMSLTSTRGMVDALEDMVPELADRFGDQAIPVLNDVIFKVRTAHEMLSGLIEAGMDAADGDTGDGADEAGADAETDGGAEAEGEGGVEAAPEA